MSQFLIYGIQLPGHKGTVTAVDFHPKEPIGGSFDHLIYMSSALTSLLLVLTGAKDATMLLGELDAGSSV